MSETVIKDKKFAGNYSRLVKSINDIAGKIDTLPDGLYSQKVVIATGDVSISNDSLDCEFIIPFDDDVEANEAEIVVYNLTSKTINAIKKNAKITVTAGYQKDTGIVFSGYVSKVKTEYEDCDKVTTIYALDSEDRKERDLVESISYAKGTRASYILRNLINKLGLPVAVFSVKRDHIYTDAVTVDGGIMQNIKSYAKVCGVSAYICKSKIYVCPLNYQNSTVYNVEPDTGLISIAEFEETETNEDYKDTIRGYECKMLLRHDVYTGCTVKLNTKAVKGTYRVREGQHTYNSDEFLTTLKVVEVV